MTPDLSIIIPIYNVAPYLSRCIESIHTQSFQNWEMILVDDGSTDLSPQICDKAAEKDGRIIVIHKENGGLSSARNSGLDIAKGKFITFVDSDDKLVDPKSFENAINILNSEPGIDIVQFQYNRFTEDIPTVIRPSMRPNVFHRRREYIENLDTCTDDWRNSIFSGAWAKVYRAELFKEIRYPVGVLWEDIIVLLQLFEISKGIAITDCGLYGFYYREDSISHSKPKPGPMTDKLNSIISVYRYLIAHSGSVILTQRVFLKLLFMISHLKSIFGKEWEISTQIRFLNSHIPSIYGGPLKNNLKILAIKTIGVHKWIKLRARFFNK